MDLSAIRRSQSVLIHLKRDPHIREPRLAQKRLNRAHENLPFQCPPLMSIFPLVGIRSQVWEIVIAELSSYFYFQGFPWPVSSYLLWVPRILDFLARNKCYRRLARLH